MIDAIIGKFLPYIIAALAALGGLWGYGVAKKKQGRSQERSERAAQDARADMAAHERMNDAEVSSGDSNADLEWLRKRGQR